MENKDKISTIVDQYEIDNDVIKSLINENTRLYIENTLLEEENRQLKEENSELVKEKIWILKIITEMYKK